MRLFNDIAKMKFDARHWKMKLKMWTDIDIEKDITTLRDWFFKNQCVVILKHILNRH